MKWSLEYLPEAETDLLRLDGSQRKLVIKAINKVLTNPLPQSEGGYGKPLGHHNNSNLTGFLKIKLKAAGIRIVYKLVRVGDKMLVVVIGAREDDEVYDIAQKRIDKNNL